MKSIIIGIAGGTGSGKTTLTERLRDHFGADEVSVMTTRIPLIPSCWCSTCRLCAAAKA